MQIELILESWKMSFQSVHFLLFLPLAAGAYFLLPGRARPVWLLLASYYFYFFAAPKYLVVLVFATALSYLLARGIAAAKSAGAKRGRMLVSVAAMLLLLSFFKYNGFFEALLTPLFAFFGADYHGGYFVTAAALGIGFYILSAVGYLVDLARGDVPLQRNFIIHALFLGFFPSVVSGPINRAGDLMPQLADTTRRFDAAGAANGLRLMAIGFFKKLAVADTLAVYANYIYDDLPAHSGLSLTLAAFTFMLQLYFDFSGYTDIALGTAGILGIRLPQNFNTPYFSTNFSQFRARWHISLSAFLQDYVFTPLVWGRWTEKLPIVGKKVQNPPVLSSLVVVFLASGLWHGDTLCYVVWGLFQAAFRIGEELLHRRFGKPKKKPSFWQRAGKTAVVLVLWMESLVFFKVGMMRGDELKGIEPGTVGMAFSALARQFSGISLRQTATDIYTAVAKGFFDKPYMVAMFILFVVICVAVAIWADWVQCFRLKGESLATGLLRLSPAKRWCVYYFIVLCCFAAFLAQNGGFDSASFLYGGY